MTSARLLPITLLALAGSAGLFLVLFGFFGDWTGREPGTKSSSSKKTETKTKRKTTSGQEVATRFGIATGAAIIAYLISSWIILAAYAFVGGFTWYSVRKDAQAKKRQERQILALATWIESLKDTMAASAGISEALAISADIAPTAISKEVRNLVVRMERQPTPVALQQFAAEIGNPVADMIVASFSLALTKQAGSLHHILGAISQNARDTATMLQEIETSRSEVKAQSKLVIGVIGFVCLFMILTQRETLVQFDTFIGQIALSFILALFALAGFLFYRLGKAEPVRRVFSKVASESAAAKPEVMV